MANCSDIVKEIKCREGNDYSEYGGTDSFSLTPVNSDVSSYCLPGHFMGFSQLSNQDYCPDYMSQRCGSQWDDKCDLYLASLENDNDVTKFIEKTANSKFCQLSKNSTCSTQCSPFDPLNNVSPSVCKYAGSDYTQDFNDSVDIGMNSPVIISPVYMMGAKCWQTCDKLDLSKLDQNDPVIDKCLKLGICQPVLFNMCQTAKDQNVTINNTNLNNFCSSGMVTQAYKKIEDKEKSQLVKLGYKTYNTSPQQPLQSRKNNTNIINKMKDIQISNNQVDNSLLKTLLSIIGSFLIFLIVIVIVLLIIQKRRN